MTRRMHEPNRSIQLIALGLTALLVGTLFFGPTLWSHFRRFAAGDPPPLDTHELEGTDLTHVHRDLLPAWVVARSQPQAEAERKAFEALTTALSPSPRLQALAVDLRESTDPDRLSQPGGRERALDVLGEWNALLERSGVPLVLRGNVVVSPRTFFYITVSEVLSEVQVRVQKRKERVRVLRRLDSLNVNENIAGTADERLEGAVVMTDEIVEFALDEVWPMLADADDLEQLGSLRASFAPAVRAEVEATLPSDTFEVLRETAAARATLMDAVRGVRERTRCSRFVIAHVPWNAMGDEDLSTFRRHVGDDPGCPSITADELWKMTLSSRTLRNTDGLEDALEALAAFAARPIILHEARHAADLRAEREGDSRRCVACETFEQTLVEDEVSAYLAELANTRQLATALAQICTALETNPSRTHHEALTILFGRANYRCEDGPRPDLADAFRDVEAGAFDEVQSVEFATEPPASIPVQSLRYS